MMMSLNTNHQEVETLIAHMDLHDKAAVRRHLATKGKLTAGRLNYGIQSESDPSKHLRRRETAGEADLVLHLANRVRRNSQNEELGVDEILAVIAAWDTDNADADVNDDGIVDTNDILLVLSAWGPCP